MRVETFPAPGTKIAATDFLVTGGGCAANAALAVARLGGRARFAGPLGDADDVASNRILADLAAEGVDTQGVVRVAGATASVSLILIDGRGEKAIATRRGKGLDAALPRDAQALIRDVDALLIDNRFPEFVTAVARAARHAGLPCVIDLDRATRPDDPLLALGTHVIASTEALFATTDASDHAAGLARLAAHHPAFLAVTDGPNGVYWRQGSTVRHMPTFQVETVDTLAAGDVFHAAFALALAEGRPLEAALRFACAAAALKCTRFGGGSAAPRRDMVEALLRG